MKTTSPSLLLGAILCAASPALAASGPLLLAPPAAPAVSSRPAELQRAHVPADARWVGHLDLQAFLGTTLWQRLRQLPGLDLEAHLTAEMAEVQQELGLDPLRDVYSLTIYGREEGEEQAVVLIETSAALDAALARFAEEEDHRVVSHRGLDLHTWDDEGYAHVVSRPDGRRLLVLAPVLDNVVEGVRVVQGQAPSIAAGHAPLAAAQPVRGSFAFFAAADGIPGLSEIEPASQVAGLATGLVLDLGETGGELVANASVQTADVDAALNLTDVIDGLVALAKLALSSHEAPAELTSILRALRVETRGAQVSVEFRYGVDALLALLQELHAEGE